MQLAQRRLARTDATVAELSAALGYATESAFSTAFKRTTGMAPKHYRERARQNPDAA
jgi:AraC-like DNA-binding protein